MSEKVTTSEVITFKKLAAYKLEVYFSSVMLQLANLPILSKSLQKKSSKGSHTLQVGLSRKNYVF